jgi:alkylation response protein AidB-like acyl-CoA dehydrogenase
VLNGTKQWITNAPYADYAMIFAVTDEEKARAHKGGITGFFLPTRTPGFSVPSVIPTMGHPAPTSASSRWRTCACRTPTGWGRSTVACPWRSMASTPVA